MSQADIRIGLDVGSTTLKCVVLNDQGHVIYKDYRRHRSRVRELAAQMLSDIRAAAPQGAHFAMSITGSAGMGMAEELGVNFVQEVYASRLAVNAQLPGTDAVIELGGEDAKILFLENGRVEARMNGSCAGGTGAFLDQMATLMNVTVEELNTLAEHHQQLYTIASRCGVFAKSDVQPLLNQGARKEDIAASILSAVVNQTIAGLAQGRPIEGNVVYLGGPLSFLPELRKRFDETLKLQGTCPEDAQYFVAYGAALASPSAIDIARVAQALKAQTAQGSYEACAPLFESEAEYDQFCRRHEQSDVRHNADPDYSGKAFIGIDAGSTTIKAVAMDENDRILMSIYERNNGDPVPTARDFLASFYEKYPKATLAGAASTGYGEDLMKCAFRLDAGLVETIAHFTAARAFEPNVDFIIDIGGQDIKCFKIRNGTVDNIFLNEACSSGCGSFLQTFASAWGDDMATFSKRGLFAEQPVDLGSRCTVFMNSSVKQAQKDGATPENISAGLSISVVKNALYKVIRAGNADALGEHIVVQGGTFLSDAVLRAFEQEVGRDVIRPKIAGLMGAYGAALHAKSLALGRSNMLSKAELSAFTRTVRQRTCQGCGNHCSLTVNDFGASRTFISGNRCEKPTGKKAASSEYNLYEAKRRWLAEYRPVKGARGRVGIPMGLGMYELLPFWHTVLTSLGFEVVVSPASTRDMYLEGQHTIPSDTVCYPAKLIHGHIEALLGMDVDMIFYPCLTYNIDEHKGDNHYNCPVVAYYPEVLHANVPGLKTTRFFYDYLGIHDRKPFEKRFLKRMRAQYPDITRAEMSAALTKGYAEQSAYQERVRETGQAYMRLARERGMPVIVLAGRPYHIDEEISHGIDKLILELGAAVISEDALSPDVPKIATNVLNQWTYHARMYLAAQYIADSGDPGINLVQLVSFGCGVDAVTTDETREILERAGRLYTQLKIDEIANLGAVKIRLRSLMAATEERSDDDGRNESRRIHERDAQRIHDLDPQYAASSL